MTRITPFVVFSVKCVIVSFTLFWGVCKVILMVNNFIISVTSWHLAFKCAYSYSNMSIFDRFFGVWLCYTVAYKLTKVYTNDTWHLPLVCLMIPALATLNAKPSSQVSRCVMLNVILYIIFTLQSYLCWWISIILAIKGRDTLRPLGIYTKLWCLVSYGNLCHFGNFLDDRSYE